MRKYFFAIISLFITIALSAQNYVLPLWDIGNDNFATKKNFTINSSFTSRYNFNDKIQIGSNVLALPLFPNFQSKIKLWNHTKEQHKKNFFSKLKFTFTYINTIVYPTIGYNLLQRYNILPLITPNLQNNITVQNDLYLSFPTNASKVCNYSGNKITLKTGFRYTFNSDTSIILPQTAFWLLNTSTFRNKDFYYFGITYDAKIFNNLNFSTSIKFYNIHKHTQILENYTFFYFGFGMKKRTTIAAGYIFDFWGQTKNYTFIPAFNISYKLQKHSKSDMDRYLRIYQ